MEMSRRQEKRFKIRPLFPYLLLCNKVCTLKLWLNPVIILLYLINVEVRNLSRPQLDDDSVYMNPVLIMVM